MRRLGKRMASRLSIERGEPCEGSDRPGAARISGGPRGSRHDASPGSGRRGMAGPVFAAASRSPSRSGHAPPRPTRLRARPAEPVVQAATGVRRVASGGIAPLDQGPRHPAQPLPETGAEPDGAGDDCGGEATTSADRSQGRLPTILARLSRQGQGQPTRRCLVAACRYPQHPAGVDAALAGRPHGRGQAGRAGAGVPWPRHAPHRNRAAGLAPRGSRRDVNARPPESTPRAGAAAHPAFPGGHKAL